MSDMLPPTPPTSPSNPPTPPLPPAQEAYLWDPGAPVDAQIAEIERATAGLRLGRNAPSAGARRDVRAWRIGMGLATAALIVLATGIGVWMWQSMGTREIGGAETTWRLTMGPGVRVSDEHGMKWKMYPKGREVTAGPERGLEMRCGTGSRVVLAPGGEATILEGAKERSAFVLRQGSARVEVAKSESAIVAEGSGHSVAFQPGATGTIDTDAKAGASVAVVAGEARAEVASVEIRLIAGMSVGLRGERAGRVPMRTDTSKELASAARDYATMVGGKFDPNGVEDALDLAIRTATARDAATLWNLGAIGPREYRQRLGERVAELLGSRLLKKKGVDFGDSDARDELWDEIVARDGK